MKMENKAKETDDFWMNLDSSIYAMELTPSKGGGVKVE